MRMINLSFIRRVLDDEQGQTMYLLLIGAMMLVLGMGGLTIDVARAYVARTQLQGAVNAAALAGVSGLASGNAGSVASTFLSKYNVANLGTITSPTPTVFCAKMMLPLGQSCTSSTIPSNAVQISASAKVPTYFMGMFGVKTLQVNAIATASPGEVKPWIVQIVLDTTPSMTASDSNCTGASNAEQCALLGIQGLLAKANPCSPGMSSCTEAQSNVRVSLMSFPNIRTSDAPDNYNCSGTVAFMPYSTPVIPTAGQTTSYTPITYTNTYVEWQSSSTNVSVQKQTLTLTYQSTYGASDAPDSSGAAEPDVNGFYTNYYNASDASGLNSASSLVKAIGRSEDSVSPCLQVPAANGSLGYPLYTNYTTTGSVQAASPYSLTTYGYGNSNQGENGGGTAFAPAIYAAETALLAEQAKYPLVNGVPTQTALIILTDGQANALSGMYPSTNSTVSSNGVNNGSGLSVMHDVLANGATSTYVPSGVSGAYPSGFDACQQAVEATQYGISTLGITRVYAVSYGAENGGCLYFANGTSGGSNNGPGSGSGTDLSLLSSLGTLEYPYGSITGIVPCTTIENMASDPQWFYSDASQESHSSGTNGINTGCTSVDNPSLTSLNNIFQGIYGSLAQARLIPNNATSSN